MVHGLVLTVTHDRIGESWREIYDLCNERESFGRSSVIRRSAVVATSSCDPVCASVDSTETCRRLADVGRVVACTGKVGATSAISGLGAGRGNIVA